MANRIEKSEENRTNENPLVRENSSEQPAGSQIETEGEFFERVKQQTAAVAADNSAPEETLPSRARILNITDSFINHCRHNKIDVAVHLCDNSKERGIIIAFDQSSIVLTSGFTGQFLVMRSAIIKITPIKSVNYIFKVVHPASVNDVRSYYEYPAAPGDPM